MGLKVAAEGMPLSYNLRTYAAKGMPPSCYNRLRPRHDTTSRPYAAKGMPPRTIYHLGTTSRRGEGHAA